MSHRVAAGEAEAELRERASRFFAFAAPAATLEAAQAFVEAVRRRFPDATHHCFAWRVGWPPAERSADAGEPSGTAGPPILAVLRGAELTDVVVVVVRYFGGTRLGKGGLVRAYGGAAAAALARLPVRVERARFRIAVVFPFAKSGGVRRLIRPPDVELAAERWGDAVELELAVVVERRAALLEALAELGVEAREIGP